MVTRPSGDIQRLAGRRNSDYSGYGHIDHLTGDYNAVANVVAFTAEVADLVWAAEAAVTAAVQTAQEIAGGAYGIGTRPMDLPRNTELGSMAFVGRSERLHLYPRLVTSATTLTADDMGKLILPNGNDITLPAGDAPGMGAGWIVAVKNRHGSNSLTVDCDGGSDTIDGGASIAIAAGAWAIVVQTGASAFVSLAV